jgi:hypothetical protein
MFKISVVDRVECMPRKSGRRIFSEIESTGRNDF